jgi:hypothetical protein
VNGGGGGCKKRQTGCDNAEWAEGWACLGCDERVVHLAHGELGVGDAYGSLGRGFRLLQLVLQLVCF